MTHRDAPEDGVPASNLTDRVSLVRFRWRRSERPILTVVRVDLRFAAAFHPVAALLAFWLGTDKARDATRLVGSEDADERNKTTRTVSTTMTHPTQVVTSSGSPE